ncbi:hypothetical protein D1BOALGB6SA_10206 [Olavius sp. associated proteobacterium Delta 1]|nr:hypothetical protein D1BOALGB6SA_10206 [Olavius sp. associated proteobacterium Delta 1]
MIGSAIDQICSRFQVSGVSKYRILIWLQLKTNTGERKSLS